MSKNQLPAKLDVELEAPADFTSPDVLYDDLIKTIRRYHPSDDISLVEKAYRVAADAHKDQKRKSGEPYIIHPLCVAIILADLEMDKETIVAAILHDVVEDTVMTLDELSKEFGSEVALLVDGVTKLTQLSWSADKVEIQAENLRKMFLAMAKDIRVILIKLADRLHNMRTLQYMKPEKQKEKAKETLEIYSPIAHRLGISKIKVELDDLALKYLEPDVYYDLAEKISLKKDSREAFVRGIVEEVSEHMKNAGIEAKVDGRVKHFFSIYKKMVNQNKTLDQIYDLFAVRIIVETVKDCYAALGVIHEMYKPIPGRFKDYIAMPKPNMYQSLHTTVITKAGVPFEVQIRTWEMHHTAEYGIAAHWKYKQGMANAKLGTEEAFEWVRKLLESQQDVDAEEFVRTMRVDLFADEVFVFTPRGDVINLPAGATPIDFAYNIHSAVGNHMTGAKVNGRMVPFDTPLNNGDIVEVITSKSAHGPSRDWMKICKSNEARNKIRQWFKKERREENISTGRAAFESELKHAKLSMAAVTAEETLPYILRKLRCNSLDELYASIGYGGTTASKAVTRVRDEMLRLGRLQAEKAAAAARGLEDSVIVPGTAADTPLIQGGKSDSGIIVEGLGNCLVKFAKCCTPVPGDPVVGFITWGYGVSVHRADCPNAAPANRKPE